MVKSIGGFEKQVGDIDHEIRYSKKMWDVFATIGYTPKK